MTTEQGDYFMKQRVLILTVVACLLALSIETLFAQNKRVGTAAATELLIPIGGRDFAMGGSTIANSKGIEAIHWNPAGLGHLDGSAEVMFSSMTYIADIGVSYGGVGAKMGDFGNLALTVKALDFGEIPLTTNDDPDGRGGRFYSPTFVTVGLSYARSLTDAISVGTTLKVISEQIDRVSASGVALDFGVQYNGLGGIKGLQLGVAVKNIGPQLRYDGPGLYQKGTASGGRRPEQNYKIDGAAFELPSLVEIGLAYGGSFQDNMQWMVNGSFTNNNLYLDEYRVGGQVGVKVEGIQLFGRAGIAMVPQVEKSQDNIFGSTFGAGLSWMGAGIGITVDYAYRTTEFFDGNQVISVKLGF
jgi:hypothetical protein